MGIMFKRLSRSKDPTISSPVGVLETTLPSGYLESIPEVNTPRNSVLNPALPPLPFRTVPPLEEAQSSNPDRSSSIYSRPSIDQPMPSPKDPVQSSAYPDISPPDSPALPTYSHSSRDVSPVDDRPLSLPKARKQPASTLRSNLPVPRKAVASSEGPITKFGNSPGWRRNASGEGVTRWDDYSGEPTTSEKGRQASATESFASAKEKKNKIKGAFRDRDPARRRASSKTENDPNVLPPEREPWKGGSGRTTLVKALRDDPSKKLAPIKIPQGPQPGSFRTPTELEASKKGRRRISFDNSHRASSDNSQQDSSDDNIKPIVPLKAGNNSPRVVETPTSPQFVSSPLTVTPTAQRSQSPALPSKSNRPVPIQLPPSSLQENKPSQNPLTPRTLEQLRNLDLDDQPGSRFSATTVGTSVQGSDSSPRPSIDAPPVPAVPPEFQRSSPASFHRPTWEPSSPKLVVRKPAPSQRSNTFDTVTSVFSKSLPQCPPEMQAVDKVASLEARLQDLAGRRRNINKILANLSNVVNPSSPGYDFKTKAEVKQTIAALNNELADIGQEEHEVGLKLHRTQKRRDRDNCYGQPTSLWVRRITEA